MPKAGARGQAVDFKARGFQAKQGPKFRKLFYQRVGHGQDMKRDQLLYILLGDATVLEKGMTFNLEPRLFDPANGSGYNLSDCLLETKGRAASLAGRRHMRKSEWP